MIELMKTSLKPNDLNLIVLKIKDKDHILKPNNINTMKTKDISYSRSNTTNSDHNTNIAFLI